MVHAREPGSRPKTSWTFALSSHLGRHIPDETKLMSIGSALTARRDPGAPFHQKTYDLSLPSQLTGIYASSPSLALAGAAVRQGVRVTQHGLPDDEQWEELRKRGLVLSSRCPPRPQAPRDPNIHPTGSRKAEQLPLHNVPVRGTAREIHQLAHPLAPIVSRVTAPSTPAPALPPKAHLSGRSARGMQRTTTVSRPGLAHRGSVRAVTSPLRRSGCLSRRLSKRSVSRGFRVRRGWADHLQDDSGLWAAFEREMGVDFSGTLGGSPPPRLERGDTILRVARDILRSSSAERTSIRPGKRAPPAATDLTREASQTSVETYVPALDLIWMDDDDDGQDQPAWTTPPAGPASRAEAERRDVGLRTSKLPRPVHARKRAGASNGVH